MRRQPRGVIHLFLFRVRADTPMSRELLAEAGVFIDGHLPVATASDHHHFVAEQGHAERVEVGFAERRRQVQTVDVGADEGCRRNDGHPVA